MKGKLLVAGVGNIFLGDDAFGVEVVKRLAQRPLPEGVSVVDFGIRSYDLAYALMDDWDLASHPGGCAPARRRGWNGVHDRARVSTEWRAVGRF